MKILIITNAFPNSAEETRGIFTYQIVKALKRRCDVEVVAPLPWLPFFLKNIGMARYPHANVPLKETLDGISVHHPRYLVIPKVLGFLHAMFLLFPLLKIVKKIDKREKIDLINAHWIFPDGVAAVWIGKMLNKPVVLTGLGCDVNLYSTMIFRRFQIVRALRKAVNVTVVSNSMKRTIVSLGIEEERVAVIPNGVDLKLFDVMERKEVRNALKLPGESHIFLTIGSQDEVKGTKYLIDAFGMLGRRTDGPLLLILIGEGPLRKSLAAMSNTFGAEKDVLFVEKRHHSEIPIWMNAADVFCLPSIREGYPNVIVEALACGIPVVASNVGGVPELINDRNGKVFEPGNVEAFRKNLAFALTANWNRKDIRKTVSGYSWEECAKDYIKVYSRSLDGRKPA